MPAAAKSSFAFSESNPHCQRSSTSLERSDGMSRVPQAHWDGGRPGFSQTSMVLRRTCILLGMPGSSKSPKYSKFTPDLSSEPWRGFWECCMFEETEWLIIKFMAIAGLGTLSLHLVSLDVFLCKGTEPPVPHTVLQNIFQNISESVMVYALCISDFLCISASTDYFSYFFFFGWVRSIAPYLRNGKSQRFILRECPCPKLKRTSEHKWQRPPAC